MTLYEFMEDFDNAELSEDEWREQMEDAVKTYYDKYDPDYPRFSGFQLRVGRAIRNYKSWRMERQRLEE
jgi:hypothetical protein